MECRIFTDPSNGATYHDLLQSARLAEGFGRVLSIRPLHSLHR